MTSFCRRCLQDCRSPRSPRARLAKSRSEANGIVQRVQGAFNFRLLTGDEYVGLTGVGREAAAIEGLSADARGSAWVTRRLVPGWRSRRSKVRALRGAGSLLRQAHRRRRLLGGRFLRYRQGQAHREPGGPRRRLRRRFPQQPPPAATASPDSPLSRWWLSVSGRPVGRASRGCEPSTSFLADLRIHLHGHAEDGLQRRCDSERTLGLTPEEAENE